MNFTFAKSNIKSIQPGDKHFRITDGLVTSGRASFEISKSCPGEYRQIIAACIDRGWIKPVAHVTEEEYMVMQLSN
jgi:hypothetical protein